MRRLHTLKIFVQHVTLQEEILREDLTESWQVQEQYQIQWSECL